MPANSSKTQCHSLSWHPGVILLVVAVLAILSLAWLSASPSPSLESASVEYNETVAAASAVGATVTPTDETVRRHGKLLHDTRN